MGTPRAPWPLVWAVLQLGCWPGWLLGRWAGAGRCGVRARPPLAISGGWDRPPRPSTAPSRVLGGLGLVKGPLWAPTAHLPSSPGVGPVLAEGWAPSPWGAGRKALLLLGALRDGRAHVLPVG